MNSSGEAPRRSKKRQALLMSAAVVIGALLTLALVLFMQNRQDKRSADKNRAESQSIITAVGQLYILPSGETPTVATIKDKAKLSGQTFFKDAQNGDYVLVYPKAKTALLYRKSVNKLVNVGPISLGNNASRSSDLSQ